MALLRWLAVGVMAAVLLVACGTGQPATTPGAPTPPDATDSADSPGDEEPIRIGAALGITGAAAFVSQQGVQGAELAISQLNDQGGVLGRSLDLIVQDSQCEPTEAVNAVRRLVEVDGAKLVIGAACSSGTLAAMPVAEELEIVLMNTMSTAPSITEQAGVGGNPWLFRINPPDSAFAPALARIIVEEQGDTSIAIVARNDDLGRGAAVEFGRALEELGAAITLEHFFPVEGPYDFSSALTEIRAADPDAIIFVGTIEPGVPFVRQYHELGMTQNLYSRGVSVTEQLFEDLGEQADGIHSTEPYYAEIDTPENEAFVSAFREMHNTDPVYQAYTTYEAVMVLAQAMEAAGTDDPAAVRDALEELTYEVITGTVDFDDNHQAWTRVYVARVTCDPECSLEIVADVETDPNG